MDWRLFIFLVPCVLYIIITIFSFLFDMWASIFTYVCMCVYARMQVHMLAGPCIGASIWQPKVDLGGLPLFLSFLFNEVFQLNSGLTALTSLVSLLAPGSPCFYLLIVWIIGWAAMLTRFWKPKLYPSHLLCKCFIHGTIFPGPYILT